MQIAYLENDLLRVGLLLEKARTSTLPQAPRPRLYMAMLVPMRRPFVATSALPEGAFHVTTMVVGRDTTISRVGRTVHGTYQGYHGEVSLLPFEAAIAEDTQERVAVHTRTSYRSPLMSARCH